MVEKTQAYIPLRRAAYSLGLPVVWLRDQARSGRVPVVRAGRRYFFNLTAVRAALEDGEAAQDDIDRSESGKGNVR